MDLPFLMTHMRLEDSPGFWRLECSLVKSPRLSAASLTGTIGGHFASYPSAMHFWDQVGMEAGEALRASHLVVGLCSQEPEVVPKLCVQGFWGAPHTCPAMAATASQRRPITFKSGDGLEEPARGFPY